MSEEERRPAAEEPAVEVYTSPAVNDEPVATESTSAPEDAPLPAAEAGEAAVTQEAAPHPVAEAAAAPSADVASEPATVDRPIPAAVPAEPAPRPVRQRREPVPDTGKKIGPYSASMWFLIASVVAFVLALISLFF